MRISELAERSGVPATTLRFYETIGLVSADRTSAGYRDYDAGAVDRLHVSTEAKRLGLTLDDIGGLLGTWTSGSCATTKADLRPRLTARLLDAQLETATLIARGGAVQVMLAHLDTLPDSDEACGPDCVMPSRPEPVIACSLIGSPRPDRTLVARGDSGILGSTGVLREQRVAVGEIDRPRSQHSYGDGHDPPSQRH
ncbi:MAG: MerR family transcriptional regulator, copper efflux regulator [Pseudonocardiales bacterium]|nr:MerR family transcriptional regulator, copper efflux regulator [Pseudonocardiales bacterium]